MTKLIGDEMDFETNNLLNELCSGKHSRFEDNSFFIDDGFLDEFIEDYIGGGLIDCD